MPHERIVLWCIIAVLTYQLMLMMERVAFLESIILDTWAMERNE